MKLFDSLAAAVLAVCLAGPAFAGATVPAQTVGDPAASDPLVGRVWVETRPASDLPGVMLVFLPDGTLLMDSCWETYALRKWTRTAPDSIAWDEDGAPITARIGAVSASELTLAVKAGPETVEHHYTTAKVPYVCPDMKR